MFAFIRLAAVALLVVAVAVPAHAGSQTPPQTRDKTQVGVGFGGYSMVDFEPFTATTVSFDMIPVLIGASFAVRLGDGDDQVVVGGKVHAKVHRSGGTDVGVGASIAFETNALGGDETLVGLGLGGGLQHRIAEHVAITADLYPISFQFYSSNTRVGLLGSGALGVTMYF